jgi:pimeloyl-ACP methyl ester carboxylesterase
MRNIVGRRQTLALGLSVVAAAPLVLGPVRVAAQSPALPEIRGKTYVLVHGAWGGGWVWAPVAERLRGMGHRVFTPTLTGLGERRHLISRDITLDTWVEDIVNVFEFEELHDVILVGHSFGGIPITGVVDRIPDRIRRVIYLDAIVPQGGRSVVDTMPPEAAAARRREAQENGGPSRRSRPARWPAPSASPRGRSPIGWSGGAHRIPSPRGRAGCGSTTRSGTAAHAPTSSAPPRPSGRLRARQ